MVQVASKRNLKTKLTVPQGGDASSVASISTSDGCSTSSAALPHGMPVDAENVNEDDHGVRELDARKLVVRMGKDGEPCLTNPHSIASFEAYYFVCWRSFDVNVPREYAECSVFPPSANSTALRRERASVMIPVASVFFVNAELAKEFGLDPHPKQEAFFPELIKRMLPPVMQPSSRLKLTALARTIVPPTTTRISREALSRAHVLGAGLDLRRSRIPDSGRGVFATRDLAENELVTVYFGHMFGEAQKLSMKQSGRGSHCKPLQFKHVYLDGVKTAFRGMGAGQLLNQGDKETCNCDWISLDVYPGSGERLLAVRATRNVFPGEELYVSYGRKFWDELQTHPNRVPPVILPKILK